MSQSQPIERVGGTGDRSQPTVVFAHANGYPPRSYQRLLQQLEGVGAVWAAEHRPLWQSGEAPVRFSWRRYADDLLNTINARFTEPVWLVGHSMGAVSSLIAAAREPARFAGVVAIDPVLLLDRMWWPAQLLGRINPDSLPIVKRALSRPHEFQSLDAAFAFYRTKRVFQRVADRELRDYVEAGHVAKPGGGVQLRWSGAWEACVYRSAPRVWGDLRRLKLPTLGLIGDQSDVLQESSVSKWQRVQPHANLQTLHGGHLLPLEAPDRCAMVTSHFIRENHCNP